MVDFDELPDADELSDEELRAWRDRVLKAARRVDRDGPGGDPGGPGGAGAPGARGPSVSPGAPGPSDASAPGGDPDAAVAWAVAGEWSLALYLRRDLPDDLTAAADCLDRARFLAAGAGEGARDLRVAIGNLRGQALLCRYEAEVEDRAPDPALLDEAERALLEALGEADDPSPFRRQALLLLARATVTRHWADRAADVLDTALERLRAALDALEPDTEDTAEAHELIGDLAYERYTRTLDRDDIDASVHHYRAAIAAAPPGSDVPLLRFALGTALLDRGRAAVDRDQLAGAVETYHAALAEARARGGDAPWWEWDARARTVYARALLWWHFDDTAQPGPAEAELEELIAEPGALDRLGPQLLDVFGRLLYERAAHRDDDAARDRALGLLRRALREWAPERDGSVGGAAVLFAALQQALFQRDGNTARLTETAEAVETALRDGTAGPETRWIAVMLRAWARDELVRRGLVEDDGTLEDRFREAREAWHGLMEAFQEGRAFFGFDDTAYNHLSNDLSNGDKVRALFDQMYAAWQGMEPGGTDHGTTAGQLLTLVPLADPHGTHVTAEMRQALGEAALRARQDDPRWQSAVRATVAGVRLQHEAAGTGSGLDDVVRQLEEARALAGDDDRLLAGTDVFRWYAAFLRGQLQNGRDDLDAALADWERFRDSPALTPYMRRMMDGQNAVLRGDRAYWRGDLAEVDRALAEIREVYAAADPEDTSRVHVWTLVESLHMKRDGLAHDLGVPSAPPLPGRLTDAELRRQAARLPRDHRAWVLGTAGLVRHYWAGRTSDFGRLGECVALLEEALELSSEGSDDWLRYAYTLGSVHCFWGASVPTERHRRLDLGIELLERAHARSGGPEHRLWASAGVALGRALRERGDTRRDDRRRGRRVGLDALRGHAWSVLLQSGTGHAQEAAAEATATALEVTGWCLRDGVPQEAVAALDSCRALVLHAATTSRSVPDLLAAAGRADLAERWRAAPDGEVPSELRRQVLAVLTAAEGTAAALLEPPDPESIGGALREVRADVLVYLVPAREDQGGSALLIDAAGGVHTLPLPTLREDAPPLRDFTAAAPAAPRVAPRAEDPRDMGPAGGAARRDEPLRKRLDRLCGWAWYAAVRPLLETVGRPPSGRDPRLVLVPMGALGAVPWHAAWAPGPADDGTRRYAVESAEFSYAASARLLCEVASRPAVPHTGAALVVGNPTGDLHYAGEEAAAVHRAFYPGGRFLGPGEARAADVLAWLRDPAGSGGVLHLACHGVVTPRSRRTAHLALYDGVLSAEELTEAAHGSERGQLELVVLAACRSHVSGRGANEAYSLATAFLVAGTRSVLGSLWPVPDDATSVLMFMAHHYLRREGDPPGRALHRAQLWMLDPARRPPGDMPPVLRERAARIDRDDLTSWAGFTHLGR